MTSVTHITLELIEITKPFPSLLKGRKVIDKKSYYNSQILEREILGFLNIEKGNRRIAVVVANLNRGWEGPPHVISYEIVGANLEVGFGK